MGIGIGLRDQAAHLVVIVARHASNRVRYRDEPVQGVVVEPVGSTFLVNLGHPAPQWIINGKLAAVIREYDLGTAIVSVIDVSRQIVSGIQHRLWVPVGIIAVY